MHDAAFGDAVTLAAISAQHLTQSGADAGHEPHHCSDQCQHPAAAARARLHAFGSTAHTEAFPHRPGRLRRVIIGSLLTGCYILLVKKSVTTGYG